MPSRREFLSQTVAAAALVLLNHGPRAGGGFRAASPTLTVYKSPSCGCCAKWVEHLRAHSFVVTVRDEPDMDALKDRLGIPLKMRSCHTAQVDGYLIEGHVPAEDIRRLLKDRPRVAGLAVPEMPRSAPGMAVPGSPAEPYEVLAFERDGTSKPFARH